MSDDLVKRLREDQPVTQDMASTMQCALQDAAADRIEELEAKLSKSEDLLAKAVDVAEKSLQWLRLYGADVHREATTLAELKGQDDE